jgi:hypothetical protein
MPTRRSKAKSKPIPAALAKAAKPFRKIRILDPAVKPTRTTVKAIRAAVRAAIRRERI